MFVRSFYIKFVYRAFSEYFPKSLFKEMLLLILSHYSVFFIPILNCFTFVMERQCGLRSYLRRVYGDNVTKEVSKYINTHKRHANVINQQDFLHQCKKKKILPLSIKFNLHLGTFKRKKFERGFVLPLLH